MKNHSLPNKLLALVLTLTMAASMTACGESASTAAPGKENSNSAAGAILLSVNPEIEVEYDERGAVLEIEGINNDGKTIIAEYENYQGRECAAVVEELVQKIYKAGYFENQVDGHAKNIVIKLENGSACPDDGFLEAVADGVRKAVKECGGASAAMVVDDDDLDAQGRIGTEKARKLVLAQLGLRADGASFSEGKYELDDGIYELEFTVDGVEYEYEVDAVTGKVLEADYDHNDDWDAWELDEADDGFDGREDIDDDLNDRDDVNDD
ncbi:Peptidase propeptide and YPEB domain-containing protein [Oscillibacter sp. PC13]|uniref:PepSY domain-containing protein n=1 Tax=Oscillibacter sp. PC13 TaxID=1855299 RepID=UPI0008E78ED0|nr:PepSY domain-containing protein [Oscillibacter sp. PC13]SFP36510.1 Peptidase propeptide and YPEB domain-containing protein [Oscillibacter sp. PC13]